MGLLGSLFDYAASSNQDTTNEVIANKNLEWQREQNRQMIELQKKTWEREDNATQRRASDLKAAGLSKTLAAGGAAATSAPVRLEAPQSGYKPGAPGKALKDLPGVGQITASALGLKQQANALLQQKEELAYTKAQKDLLELKKSSESYNLDWYRKRGLPFGSGVDPLERKSQWLGSIVGQPLSELNDRFNAVVDRSIYRAMRWMGKDVKPPQHGATGEW